jgi:hypothetical protein
VPPGRGQDRAPDDPGLERILRAAVKNDFPVNVPGNVDAGTALIDRHPDARSQTNGADVRGDAR